MEESKPSMEQYCENKTKNTTKDKKNLAEILRRVLDRYFVIQIADVKHQAPVWTL